MLKCDTDSLSSPKLKHNKKVWVSTYNNKHDLFKWLKLIIEG